MSQKEQIIIHSIESVEELEKVRELESRIWSQSDSIPTHQTLTSVKNGGFVLGAYSHGELVGFQYSFPGYDGQSIYLCSHILGIDSQFRSQGIGEKLKHAQREKAAEMGYSYITWTYDPLESANAYLNIAKLGAVGTKYCVNYYGQLDDSLNGGLPSDRFLVEWRMNQHEVKSQQALGEKEELETALDRSLIQWEINKDGFPIPKEADHVITSSHDFLYVAIPTDFQGMKEKDMLLAQDWRMATRNVFTHAFREGWQVIRFLKNTNKNIPVHFYVLIRRGENIHEN
ncbi:GNAT family N-acetyltransferase [Ammoniphilus sp. 3BR4]